MLIIPSLIFGILSAIFALAVETLIRININISSGIFFLAGIGQLIAFFLILLIAVIEELSKYIFLKQYAKRLILTLPFSLLKSIAMGAFFGLGFSIVESTLLLYKYQLLSDAFFVIPITASLHITTSTIFSIFLFSSYKKFFKYVSAMFIAIFLHSLYNILIVLIELS